MAEKRTIARPYARAMFQNAQDDNDSFLKLLKILALAVLMTDIDQAIKNPSIQNDQVITFLVDICEDADAVSLEQFGRNCLVRWLRLLSAAKRLECLPQIAELFSEECVKHKGAMDVVVSSAEPLTDLQKNDIIQNLSKKWNKIIQANYKNDPTLMGGVKIQAGDWVLDRSIADKLLRLSEDIAS